MAIEVNRRYLKNAEVEAVHRTAIGMQILLSAFRWRRGTWRRRLGRLSGGHAFGRWTTRDVFIGRCFDFGKGERAGMSGEFFAQGCNPLCCNWACFVTPRLSFVGQNVGYF